MSDFMANFTPGYIEWTSELNFEWYLFGWDLRDLLFKISDQWV